MTETTGLIAPPQLAEYIGVTVQRLAEWRHHGTGPRFIRAGRLIRYRPEDVNAWIEAQTVETAGGAA
jgi:predicted DNA-binding transcriptional regulator AlpA